MPWRQIVGMRHRLVHRYFGVDLAVLWQVVQEDVPRLAAQIEVLLPTEAGERTGDEGAA